MSSDLTKEKLEEYMDLLKRGEVSLEELDRRAEEMAQIVSQISSMQRQEIAQELADENRYIG